MPSELSRDEYTKWYRQAGLPELRQILYWCWDPIEVNAGFPYNDDEYDEYVPGLLSRLRKGADAAEIGAYLRHAQRDDMAMGLRDPGELADLSERIVLWYGQSIKHWIEFTARRVTHRHGHR